MSTTIAFKPRTKRQAYLAQIVDQLGAVKAAIAAQREEEAALRKLLISEGVGEYRGDAFDASVSHTDRETLDMAAVRSKLSPQFIAAHTVITPVDIVKVVARKGTVLT